MEAFSQEVFRMAGHRTDLTSGPVMKKLVLFTLPIILTNVLQQLYHAADMMVVGNFAQNPTVALAAVGSTASITSLILNLFIGLSVGTNVICANLFGAGEREKLRRAMHTSLLLAALCGVGIAIFGVIFSRTLLEWMGTPDSVIDQATLYMQIIFLGKPGSLVYNFGAGILRAHGDTKRPMYILSFAGILNCLLNVFFVVVVRLDAAGVALATVASYYVTAFLVLRILFSPKGEFQLSLRELRLNARLCVRIAKVGIPCGVNGMVFSLSNVIIVTALNTLGDVVLAGNSAAHNVDGLLFQVLSAISAACVSFSGQCFGAKKYRRIDRLLTGALLFSFLAIVFVDAFLFLFPEEVLSLFTKDPAVIAAAVPRVLILCGCYVVYIVPEICIGCIRGMGHSTATSVLNMIFICIPRVIWVLFLFPLHPTFSFLLWCYPISWGLSGVVQFICYLVYRHRLLKEETALPA